MLSGEYNKETPMVFATPDDFFSSKAGEVLDDTYSREENPDEGEIETERSKTMKIGEDVYSLSVYRLSDVEGKIYREEWKKNGAFHRDGDLPAEVYSDEHRIPEETYLDKAGEKYYVDGEFVRKVDTTYEDIISHKPSAVRRAFGYDV